MQTKTEVIRIKWVKDTKLSLSSGPFDEKVYETFEKGTMDDVSIQEVNRICSTITFPGGLISKNVLNECFERV